MMPWGHLAFGYLVYTFVIRIRHRRAPKGAPTIALAIGTQFPDLIDKPLNWWFDIYDGRAIGHSLFTSMFVCAALFFWARKRDQNHLALIFAVGVLTHLLGDSWGALLSGNLNRASFLLWPLFPAPTYPSDGFLDHLRVWLFVLRTLRDSPKVILSSRFGFQLVIFLVLLGVWAIDGFPGLKTVVRRLTGRREGVNTDS